MPRKHHHPHHHHRADQQRAHQSPRRSAVSPADLIREDFQRMLYTMRLRTTQPAAELILMQSVEGHAQMGHGSFAGRRFPNTEMDDIVEALQRNPRAVALQRQDLIDEVVAWTDAAVAGRAGATLVNEIGEGLIGCGVLRHLTVNPPDVLRGLYLGGLRDDSDVRLEVERRTGARIGGGRCRFVDVEAMERLGLDGDQLAKRAHANDLAAFQREGLLVDDPGPDAFGSERIRYMYIRERLGGGASDDAAIIAAGKVHNLSVALGVFLADAIDTLEKFVVDYADQDNDLARDIEQRFSDLSLTSEDVYRLTWLCAVPPEEQSRVPDSSLRHLLEIDRETDQCALDSHLAYLSGHPYSPMLLASEEVPNGQFYEWCRTRMEGCPL
jgi:hypothetical protein